jgi:hypothetical protein
MNLSLRPYIQSSLSFGLYALEKADSSLKTASCFAVSHFALNYLSDTKSDILDATFYLLTRNIIALACTSLLSMDKNSPEEESLTMTVIKHTAVPTLLGIICGKFLSTRSEENPLTWQHVIGMEILRKLKG